MLLTKQVQRTIRPYSCDTPISHRDLHVDVVFSNVDISFTGKVAPTVKLASSGSDGAGISTGSNGYLSKTAPFRN